MQTPLSAAASSTTVRFSATAPSTEPASRTRLPLPSPPASRTIPASVRSASIHQPVLPPIFAKPACTTQLNINGQIQQRLPQSSAIHRLHPTASAISLHRAIRAETARLHHHRLPVHWPRGWRPGHFRLPDRPLPGEVGILHAGPRSRAHAEMACRPCFISRVIQRAANPGLKSCPITRLQTAAPLPHGG